MKEYIILTTNKSSCPYCKKYVDLLSTDNYNPRAREFFICFNCHKVWEVGVGEVQRESND